MMQKSRLPRQTKYELSVYYGAGGIWQRVKAVDSIEEAENYLRDKTFYSAQLFTRKRPCRVVREFKGKNKKSLPWLR
jgi:hypothetical protein